MVEVPVVAVARPAVQEAPEAPEAVVHREVQDPAVALARVGKARRHLVAVVGAVGAAGAAEAAEVAEAHRVRLQPIPTRTRRQIR